MKTFDPTKPVQTRDGRKARILCTDRKDTSYPLLALVTDEDDAEFTDTFTPEGLQLEGDRDGRPGDLVNIPERHVRYFSAGDAYLKAAYARNRHDGEYPIIEVVTDGENGPVISSAIVPA